MKICKKMLSFILFLVLLLTFIAPVSASDTIPGGYDYVSDFIDGLAIARKGDKWGVIDTNGEAAVPVEYHYVLYITSALDRHYYWVQHNETWGVKVVQYKTGNTDGDANDGDNIGPISINAVAASLVLQYDAKLIDAAGLIANGLSPATADFNGDGKIDAIDASLMLQYDAKLI